MGPVVPRHAGSSQTRNWTRVSCRWILYPWATREALQVPFWIFLSLYSYFYIINPIKVLNMLPSHFCNSWVIWNSLWLIGQEFTWKSKEYQSTAITIVTLFTIPIDLNYYLSWDSMSTISGLREKSSPDIPIILLWNKNYGVFFYYLCLIIYVYHYIFT